jgi:hypothetical protein
VSRWIGTRTGEEPGGHAGEAPSGGEPGGERVSEEPSAEVGAGAEVDG